MHFGSIPEFCTTISIFTVHQLQQKFPAINKTLYMALVNLEIAFDHVHRRVIWWALCKPSVEECPEHPIQIMYKMPGAECMLVAIWVKGSVLKCLWFWKPSPKSFVQDLPEKTCVQMTCLSSLNRWRNFRRSWSYESLSCKVGGFLVNMGKTKVLIPGPNLICFRSPTKTPVPCVSRMSVQTPDEFTRDALVSLALWCLTPPSGVNDVLDWPDQ